MPGAAQPKALPSLVKRDRGKNPHQPDCVMASADSGGIPDQHTCCLPPGLAAGLPSSRITIDSHLQSRPFHPCPTPYLPPRIPHGPHHTVSLHAASRSLMAAPLSCLDCVAHWQIWHTHTHSRPSREAVCPRLPPNIRFRRAENSPFGRWRGWYTACSVPSNHRHPS